MGQRKKSIFGLSTVLGSLCLCFLFGTMTSSGGRFSRGDPTDVQPFTVKHVFLLPQKDRVTVEYEGQMRWLTRSQDSWSYDLEFRRVDVRSESEESAERHRSKLPSSPWTARVTVAPTQDIPVEIEVVQGKVEGEDAEVILRGQYREAIFLSDMVFLTVVKKSFEAGRKQGLSGPAFAVNYAERIRLGEAEVREAKAFRHPEMPKVFAACTLWNGRSLKASDLLRLTRDRWGLAYYYRRIDNGTGLGTHAVNIQATLPLKEGAMDVSYEELLQMTGDPSAFEVYQLSEVRIGEVM